MLCRPPLLQETHPPRVWAPTNHPLSGGRTPPDRRRALHRAGPRHVWSAEVLPPGAPQRRGPAPPPRKSVQGFVPGPTTSPSLTRAASTLTGDGVRCKLRPAGGGDARLADPRQGATKRTAPSNPSWEKRKTADSAWPAARATTDRWDMARTERRGVSSPHARSVGRDDRLGGSSTKTRRPPPRALVGHNDKTMLVKSTCGRG